MVAYYYIMSPLRYMIKYQQTSISFVPTVVLYCCNKTKYANGAHLHRIA